MFASPAVKVPTTDDRRPRPVFDPEISGDDRALLDAAPERLVAAHLPAPSRPRPSRAVMIGRAVWVPLIAVFYGVLPGGWMRLCFLALDEEEDELVDGVFRWGGAAVAAMMITPVLQIVLILLRLGEVAALLATVSFSIWAVAAVRHLREPPAARAARRHHGRYLLPGDFDRLASRLLMRAQRACDAVLGSLSHRAGLLDGPGDAVVLPREEWAIATTLAEHTRLRREQTERLPERPSQRLLEMLEPQRRALDLSVGSVIARIEALEAYARQTRELDDAYREWEAVQRVSVRNERYRDLLAATVRDDLAREEIGERAGDARRAGSMLRAETRDSYYRMTKSNEK